MRGFTLLELLVVLSIIALATAGVGLALRDSGTSRLEREGERLAALFESARAEARAAGLLVRWRPVADNSSGAQFRFEGLPARMALPSRWLGEPVAVEILGGAGAVVLGPEPVIGAQSLRLTLGRQQIVLRTDGLGPFELQSASEAP